MKNILSGHHFSDDQELINELEVWFQAQTGILQSAHWVGEEEIGDMHYFAG